MDKVIASAEKNVGKGTLNNEMATALTQSAKQVIMTVDSNMDKFVKSGDDQYPTLNQGLSFAQQDVAKD